MQREIKSKRQYKIVWVENGETIEKVVTLPEIYESEEEGFEWQYSLQDKIDEILDLKPNETMYCQFNRGGAWIKGIIERIR
jgi:hypothetical protein